MSWLSAIHRCPRCGVPATAAISPFTCAACGFTLFANPAVGVGIFASDSAGRVLFVRRAKDPSKGLLGIPGGFVDPGESAEAALAREVREEIGGELTELRFLCSVPNRYAFAGVTYDVCDLFFAGAIAGEPRPDLDEISACVSLAANEVRPEMLAFHSTKTAWTRYLAS